MLEQKYGVLSWTPNFTQRRFVRGVFQGFDKKHLGSRQTLLLKNSGLLSSEVRAALPSLTG